MKKILYAAMLSILGFSAQASVSPQSDMILSLFHNSYRYAKNVTIAEVDGMYRVDFTEDGSHRFAYYNASGEVVVNAEIRQKTDLPLILQKQLDKQFGSATLLEVYIVNAESTSDYFAVVVENGKRKILQAGARRWYTFQTAK